MGRDIELVKNVSIALEAEKLSIPVMRSILTMLEKNSAHANIEITKCYNLRDTYGQNQEIISYEGRVPLEVLRLVGSKLFDKKERLNSYDTYGVNLVGFERLLVKAEARGVDSRGYERIYATVVEELGKRMMDEFLIASGMMVRN